MKSTTHVRTIVIEAVKSQDISHITETQRRVFVLAGLFFGLAIHFKIYPVIYSFSFYLALSDLRGWRSLFQARISF